jgi:hypothetical protein
MLLKKALCTSFKFYFSFSCEPRNKKGLCVISRFCRVVNDVCALWDFTQHIMLVYYRRFGTFRSDLEYGTDKLFRNAGDNSPFYAE